MKVVCLSNTLIEGERQLVGEPYSKSDFHVTMGKEYLVYGMSFQSNSETVCFVEILSDYNHLISVPIMLFEIKDRRVSKYWEIKIFENKSITYWPPSFYREYYHDDLFEEVDEIVKDFEKVRREMEIEFS